MTTTQHLRDKSTETEAPSPQPTQGPSGRSTVSRRGLLGVAGVGLAGLAAGAAGGYVLGSEETASSPAPPGTRGTIE